EDDAGGADHGHGPGPAADSTTHRTLCEYLGPRLRDARSAAVPGGLPELDVCRLVGRRASPGCPERIEALLVSSGAPGAAEYPGPSRPARRSQEGLRSFGIPLVSRDEPRAGRHARGMEDDAVDALSWVEAPGAPAE